MPNNKIPVEKEPIKKYFKAASLLNIFFLSDPVNIYKGIDKISMPKNNINKLSNDVNMLIPHKMKKNKL